MCPCRCVAQRQRDATAVRARRRTTPRDGGSSSTGPHPSLLARAGEAPFVSDLVDDKAKSAMIGLAARDLRCAIELFERDEPRHLMEERQRRQRPSQVRACEDGFVQTLGSADRDDKTSLAGPLD